MKKLLLILILLLTFISCRKDERQGIFTYEFFVESPYDQLFLVEFVNPNFPGVLFSDMFFYNGYNFWKFEDTYYEGDYLEIVVTPIDNFQPVFIDLHILVNDTYVNIYSGIGLTPIKLSYN